MISEKSKTSPKNVKSDINKIKKQFSIFNRDRDGRFSKPVINSHENQSQICGAAYQPVLDPHTDSRQIPIFVSNARSETKIIQVTINQNFGEIKETISKIFKTPMK